MAGILANQFKLTKLLGNTAAGVDGAGIDGGVQAAFGAISGAWNISLFSLRW